MDAIAAVYARALFEVALGAKKLDLMRQQLGEFIAALKSSHDLQVFLFSPYFSTEEKKKGLAGAVSGADPEFFNFLELLVEKHRMPVIFRIERRFERLWDDYNRLLPVEVTSAIELDRATIDEVGSRIAQQTGRRVEIKASVDSGILGGMIVRVGNAILDASIRNRLEELRKEVAV